jgi:hypothetical protein
MIDEIATKASEDEEMQVDKQGDTEFDICYSFVDLSPLVYQTRLEKVLSNIGQNDKMAKIGKKYYTTLDFVIMTNGILQMVLWGRVDPLEFTTLNDIIDHIFVNETEENKYREL